MRYSPGSKMRHPSTPSGIHLLPTYARECVRQFLHATGAEEPPADAPGLKGFRVPASEVARQLRGAHADVFSDDLEDAMRRRRGTLQRWMLDPPEEMEAFAALARDFDLTDGDMEILIMAGATAIDPAIEQVYSYVWNDVRKRDADVGFVCRVLALGDVARFESLLARCDHDAPLRRHRIVVLDNRTSGDDGLERNLVGRRIRVADRILDFLRGEDRDAPSLDEDLAAVCTRYRQDIQFEALHIPNATCEGLMDLARDPTPRALLEGPQGAGKQLAAQALAHAAGKGLLVADLTALLHDPAEVLRERLSALSREARLGGDLLYLQGHRLPDQAHGSSVLVLQHLLKTEAVLLGVDKLPSWAVRMTAGWATLPVPLPDADHRLLCWEEAFQHDEGSPDRDTLHAIARRFQMSAGQIRQAASEARRVAQVARRKRIDVADVDGACRAHFAHKLSDLADVMPPSTFRPADLILSPHERQSFEEILLVSREQDAVYEEWGFGEKFPYGRGLSVLFYGPPGTGKTMAATIIASELGLDLFRVDLSRIVSKFVGETEKNLARVFDEAERGRVMLLFDEAESMFTKRTDVNSSIDRYANLEVAYLLQRMETFEGVTVLTTNVDQYLDDAFKRRIRYRIYFPMPDADTRTMLWQSFIPDAAPLRDNIPFDLIGEQFELAGGHIKKAVLRSAFYARRESTKIGLKHLVDAARAECSELGNLLSDHISSKLSQALLEEEHRKSA